MKFISIVLLSLASSKAAFVPILRSFTPPQNLASELCYDVKSLEDVDNCLDVSAGFFYGTVGVKGKLVADELLFSEDLQLAGIETTDFLNLKGLSSLVLENGTMTFHMQHAANEDCQIQGKRGPSTLLSCVGRKPSDMGRFLSPDYEVFHVDVAYISWPRVAADCNQMYFITNPGPEDCGGEIESIVGNELELQFEVNGRVQMTTDDDIDRNSSTFGLNDNTSGASNPTYPIFASTVIAMFLTV